LQEIRHRVGLENSGWLGESHGRVHPLTPGVETPATMPANAPSRMGISDRAHDGCDRAPKPRRRFPTAT
jgi:hypothetical protein